MAVGFGKSKLQPISLNLTGVVSTMATRDVTVGPWAWVGPPTTVPLGSIQVTITGGPAGLPAIPSVSVAANATTAVVPAVPVELATDPKYVATVRMLDPAGVQIGAASVSAPFSVLTNVTGPGTPGAPAISVGPVNP